MLKEQKLQLLFASYFLYRFRILGKTYKIKKQIYSDTELLNNNK